MNNKEKELHVIAAKYILGENITKKISGKNYVIDTYVNLLEVSRKLYLALKEENNISEVTKLLDEKRNLVIKFKKLSGINWRL